MWWGVYTRQTGRFSGPQYGLAVSLTIHKARRGTSTVCLVHGARGCLGLELSDSCAACP